LCAKLLLLVTMGGWEWKDEEDVSSQSGDVDESKPSRSGNRCSTRKIISSHCRTEEVEPGKFVRKCEKTEQIFKDCFGRPSEVVQSNKEYTEEDVTDQVVEGSFPLGSSSSLTNGPFDFPGLRSDIEAIERSFFGGVNRFLEAAEEMKNGFFNSVFRDPQFHEGDSSSTRRDIPNRPPPREASPKPEGHVDLSGLARDV